MERGLDQTGSTAPSPALLAGASGAWEWDVATSRLYGDARFAELCGLDRAAAIAGVPTEAFFGAIHPDDRMRIRIAVAGVMHGVDIFSKEYRLADPKGAVRWVSARGQAERNPDHRAVRFTGVLTDVTEQKRVEERLRVAQSAGGVGTFEYISGFGTAEVSEQFCQLLGLNAADTLPLRTINAAMPSGEAPLIGGYDEGADGELPHREILITRADTGERRWIARRGELRHDGPDGGARLIGVIYDITDFRTVEGKLRALTDNLEAMVRERTRERDRVWNNSHDLLVVVAPDGVFRSVSPSWTAVLGYDSDDLVGRTYRDFIVPDDAEATSRALAEITQGRNVTNFENRYRHKHGGVRWISWQTSYEEGLVYAYGRDITEEKAKAEALAQTESQLRQAQKMEAVGQLTGGLAHDFNNLLTGIMGGLDILRRRIAEGRMDDIDRFMDAAIRSAERAASLTHRLLAFSRRQSLDTRSIDIGALILSMEDLLVRTLGEQVSLTVMTTPDLGEAISDANQLESALLNLAINARDAMPEGGRLTIEASNVALDAAYAAKHADVTPGDYVVVSVSDTGEGMPPDVVAQAFDPFFTTKPIGQGTGLGLSMIYGFMRQIGGHVGIYSELGSGTTVKLYMRRSERPAAPEAPRRRDHAAPAGAGETVMVVEDDEAVRFLILEVLAELGYRSLEAVDGQAALPALRSGAPIDLLITDVGLPGLNGRQLAEIAREHRPDLGVLFVTGYAANAAVRGDFLEPGMEMISKPFAMAQLAAKVSEMLAARRS